MNELTGNKRAAQSALLFLQRVTLRWEEMEAADAVRKMLREIVETGTLVSDEESPLQEGLPLGSDP